MENIFTLDVFLISLPIYLACIMAGFMLAIRPKRAKNKTISSFSQKLADVESEDEELKLDNIEDFDLYVNVSSMYRKNGEFIKAVQIHQKMLDKATLTNEMKAKVLLELGMDYLASGMFDQAEEKLLACLTFTTKSSYEEYMSCSELSKLYERQKKWSDAVVYRRKIANDNQGHRSGLALLLCNLAEEELLSKNIGNAKQFYQNALELDFDCVLAVKQLIDLAFQENKNQEAFDLLKNYSTNSVRLLNLLVDAFEKLLTLPEFTEKTLELLSDLVKSDKCCYELGILYAKVLHSSKNIELQDFLTLYTEQHKDNLQAIYAMALFLKESGIEYDSKDHHNVLLEKIENMLKKEYNYQCGSCGYHTKQEFWYCPQCQKWNTVERIYR